MQVVDCPLIKISPYEKNPRKNEAAIDKVAASIQEFGFQQPIVVDKHYVIVAGHTRYLAAQRLQLVTVPVIVADRLTDAQIRAYRLADNRTHEDATWDIELLTQEIIALNEEGYNLDLTGFTPEELDMYLLTATEESLVADDDCPALDPDNIITKPGNRWRLGNHTLYCGDATSTMDLATLLNGVQADMVFTDPPYNIDYNPDTRPIGGRARSVNKLGGIKNDKMEATEFRDFIASVYSNLITGIKGGACVYICHSDSVLAFRTEFEKAFKMGSLLVWVKNKFVISRHDYHWKHEPILYGWQLGTSHKWHGDRSQTTVWEISTDNGRDYVHPTQKPVELAERAILNSSKTGDIILDVFGGSGSTLIACEKNKRRGYLMELDPKYCDVIIKRWENYTGQKAVLE